MGRSLSETTSTVKGKIVGFEQHGTILVAIDDISEPVSCFCLNNSSAPLPEYALNDRVVVVTSDEKEGFIIGRIELYIKTVVEPEKQHGGSDILQVITNNDEVTLRGKKIKIVADEEAVIECGNGSLRLEKNGDVALRGARLLSRASGTHKIKGAAVLIN